ncbi:MAG TPA: hypothetical protein VNW51_00255, partial [Mucilaginibacter sp.]|nr:hypothetical protein [Mucilaginibacter sp.]
MNSKAVVIGYSGHAYVLLDMLMNNHIEILGYCEAKEKEQNPYRLRYLGHELDEQVIDILKANQCYLGVGDNKVREKIFQSLLRRGVAMPHLIYLDAVISPLAQIGSATVVMPGVVINSMVSIGNGVICNSACVIEHECIIEDYAHIAP